jgi:hypothetical protein
LIFTAPTGLSFGLLRAGKQAAQTFQVTDAGGGSGTWTVSVVIQNPASGVSVTAPASVDVPGALPVEAKVAAGAAQADVTGFVVLQRGDDMRRVPFWLRSESPRLGKPSAVLTKAGTYRGNARLGSSRVSSYRYPDNPGGSDVSNNLPGPEQVFRVRLSKTVANFGVIVTGQARNVSVTPRIVFPGDENHLVGVPALPLNEDPYQDTFGQLEPVSAVIAPSSRIYDVVFDTRGRSQAGPFTFRLWINDTAPPVVKLLAQTVSAGQAKLLLSVTDKGSGVDPSSLVARVDGQKRGVSVLSGGKVAVIVDGLARGKHTLELTVSDYQETKNMEAFGNPLPNTRDYRASFTVR